MADDPHWDLPEDSATPQNQPGGPAQPGQPDQLGEPAQPAKPPISRRRWWTLTILKAVAAVAVLGLVSLTAIVVIGYQTVKQPDPNADFTTATTNVFYNDGKSRLGTFEIQNRQPLTFEEIPEEIKQAVVAAENRTFWTDRGISFRGMVRAAWAIARGESIQGGSTITQQYIKIMYLNREQTLSRKFKELFLAAKINKQLTKEQILTDYLNTIYFGRDAYGIQAASQAYFDVNAPKLTVPQVAVLASVINNPSAFDPGIDDDNAERLLGRYRYVLQSMSETGAITPEEAATHSVALPKFPKIKASERYGGPKGFLLKMVQRELEGQGFDSTKLNGGGLKIITTFDEDAQDAAVEAAKDYTERAAEAAGEKKAGLHAAIASVEVGTGEVIALYGGPDYVENSRNWATTPRPTASTFKAYALAAGLEDGYSLRSRFTGNTFTPPGESQPIRNEFSNQYGQVSLLRATAESINTAFVDLVTSMDDGAEKVIKVAKDAGLPEAAGFDASPRNLPLGTPEASPLAQAGAFATFGNDGKHVPNHVVREVRDADDQVIYKAAVEEKRAVSSDIAADVTYALSSVVEEGTGRSVQTLNRPVAGKTGTKDRGDDITSAWFVAYTKQISTAVMYVAGDSGTADLDDYRRPGDSTFFGGTYPALTWADYMETATKGQPVKEFDEPAFVNQDAASAPKPTRTRQPVETRSSEPEPSKTEPSETESESSEPTETVTETERPTEEPTTSAPPTTREPAPTTRAPTRTATGTRSPTREGAAEASEAPGDGPR